MGLRDAPHGALSHPNPRSNGHLAGVVVRDHGELGAVSSEGGEAIAEMLLADPRYSDDVATLRMMAADADSVYLEDGVAIYQQLDLLLTKEWEDPADLLERDPKDVRYDSLIQAATARAERAEDPSPMLALKARLEAAHAAQEFGTEDFDRFVEHLATLDSGTAERILDRLARQVRHRREDADG